MTTRSFDSVAPPSPEGVLPASVPLALVLPSDPHPTATAAPSKMPTARPSRRTEFTLKRDALVRVDELVGSSLDELVRGICDGEVEAHLLRRLFAEGHAARILFSKWQVLQTESPGLTM